MWNFPFASMGCPCEITLEGVPAPRAEEIASLAHAEVDRLDRKYSHYRDDSLIADWARRAGDRIEVDTESADLLDFAETLNSQSDGMFDLTARPLTRLWDRHAAPLPSKADIAQALAAVGWSRLYWRRPWLGPFTAETEFDLGGIVKEYAADRAALICREAGAAHGVVDLGGDLAVIGAHADGSAWRIGIKDPTRPVRAIAQIGVGNGGLATSGDYERSRLIDGVRYSHIIDPRSGWPVQSYASVSVVAPSCLVAGAAATLAMLLGVDAGLAYLDDLGLAYLCVRQDGTLVQRTPL